MDRNSVPAFELVLLAAAAVVFKKISLAFRDLVKHAHDIQLIAVRTIGMLPGI